MKISSWIMYAKVLLPLAVILTLTTGCWDRQEIEERAVVLGIGIDMAESGGVAKEEEVSHLKETLPTPNIPMVHATVQIAVPGRIPLGPGSTTGGGGGGGTSTTVWVVDAEGHTIDDAINNLQELVAPPLFFGHLRVIVVSEDIARKGIENLNDYFRRSPEIRRLNWMMISKGKAKDIMKASPQLERVPTLYLLTNMDQAVKMGRFPNNFLGEFWSSASAKGKEGLLPYVDINSKDNIVISGIAYFKKDKMVGTTKPLEVPLYMGIMGQNPAGGQGYVQVPGTSEYMEFHTRNRKALTKVSIENGIPHISLKIQLEGNLREKTNDNVKLTDAVIKLLEQKLEENGKEAYMELITKTQKKGSDIFGFGEQVRAKEWRYWNKEIKTKENWQKMYAHISVDISVEIHLRRIGMKAV
jgi:spore germination protein KC